MQYRPTNVVGEILGEPAEFLRNSVNLDYQCPFINSECTKRSQRISGPYPVCSVFHGTGSKRKLVSVCPKRFFQASFKQKVIETCWTGDPPENPVVVHEIKMGNFGNVDFVIADLDESQTIVRQFIGVELQAVDITGTVEPAYQAIINNEEVGEQKPRYGMNWANVRKRYITQLINKGFFHHLWETKIVAVIQVPLLESLRTAIKFDELDPKSDTSTIVFMLYDFRKVETGSEYKYEMEFVKAVGTSHNSLMTASLYRTAPSKRKFEERILSGLNRR